MDSGELKADGSEDEVVGAASFVNATTCVSTATLVVELMRGEFISEHSRRSTALLSYLREKRWYRDKARRATGAHLVEAIALSESIALLLARVHFEEGAPSEYGVPVFLLKSPTDEDMYDFGDAVIFEMEVEGISGRLIDATSFQDTAALLLDYVVFERESSGEKAKLVGTREGALLPRGSEALSRGRLLLGEQTNTNYQFGERFVLKLQRKLEPTRSLEIEVLAQLARVGFAHAPRLLGTLEVHRDEGASSLGILQTFVKNEGDAWSWARMSAEHFTKSATLADPKPPPVSAGILAFLGADLPSHAAPEDNFFLQVELLGRRTAELHRALSLVEEPDTSPEEWCEQSRSAFCQSLSEGRAQVFALLRRAEQRCTEEEREFLRLVLQMEEHLQRKIDTLSGEMFSGVLMRVHGDLHLGQVLLVREDFVFVDFEGEPAKNPTERRRKRSPLADVAGMLRSFHYAACSQFLEHHRAPLRRSEREKGENAQGWAEIWQHEAGARFLRGYTQEDAKNSLLPREKAEFHLLLEAHLLEKALYEVIYELENRPMWVEIPLRALISMANSELG